MEKNDKESQLKKELNKLRKIFKDLPEESKKLSEGLIQNAAFMHVTLLELQEDIKEHGAMINCTSGNGFETLKDNPAQKAYTTMISRYSLVIKQLTDLLPEQSETTAGAEIMAFLDKD